MMMSLEDQAFESSSVTLSSMAPRPPERRSAPRALSILRVGKLTSAAGEELCRIRNISAGGIMAEVASSRSVGDLLSIELKNDQVVSGTVVWTRDSTVGIRFDRTVDVGEVLANTRSERGHESRAPRVRASCRARLRVGAKYYNVNVHDISQGGIKLEIQDPYCVPGRETVIMIDGLGAFEGSVRWCSEGLAGIAFNQAIPFENLTHWLGSRFAAGQVEGTARKIP